MSTCLLHSLLMAVIFCLINIAHFFQQTPHSFLPWWDAHWWSLHLNPLLHGSVERVHMTLINWASLSLLSLFWYLQDTWSLSLLSLFWYLQDTSVPIYFDIVHHPSCTIFCHEVSLFRGIPFSCKLLFVWSIEAHLRWASRQNYLEEI